MNYPNKLNEMARRTFYATIRIDLSADVDEITDEMVEEFSANCLYDFPGVDVSLQDGSTVGISADAEWQKNDY